MTSESSVERHQDVGNPNPTRERKCNLDSLLPTTACCAHENRMSRRPFSTYVYTALFLGTLLLLARNDAPASTFSRYFPRPPPRPSPASPCPIPWLNDTSTPAPPKALSCVPVPTNHTEFAVQLCFDSTACNQGYVQVEYLNKERCDQVERELNPSKAEEQNNYVKGKLGPHTLSVLFDGAVRDGREKPEYLGRCAYRYPYQLNNGGRFALRVVLVYEVRRQFRHS